MDDLERQKLADRLRFLCDQVGGAAALAGLLDIHRTSLFGYLSVRNRIPKARLRSIAARYPCSLEWLETGNGAPPEPDIVRRLMAKDAAKGASRKLLKEAVLTNPTTYTGEAFKIISKGRETVLLEPTREQLGLAIKADKAGRINQVLGDALTQLVIEGRACPSLELMYQLRPVLGQKLDWILGLEG